MLERRWGVFVTGSGINPTHSSPQLFQCASEELENNLLKIDANITSTPTKNLLSEMKSLAVTSAARGVLRAELFQIRQDRGESFRSYAANGMVWYGNSLFDITEKYIVIAKYLIKYMIYVWRLHKEYIGCSLPCSHFTKVRGKAETCSYTTRCSCDLTINFTDIIVKDVLIAGIADLTLDATYLV